MVEEALSALERQAHVPLWLLYALCTGHLVTVATTLYLHRSQTHRAVKFHPIVEHPLRFVLFFFNGVVTREWVSIHRKHHQMVETEDDPHSPAQLGIWRVFFGGFWLYRKEANNPETIRKYGVGLKDDWLERNLYGTRLHWLAIVLVLPTINVLLFGWVGLAAWAIQMVWIPLLAAGVINGIGHFAGSRTFETPDQSRNVFPRWLAPLFAFFLGGEEWHNNHHGAPASAKLSSRKGEFDLGWQYIRLLRVFGLAKDIKVSRSQLRSMITA